MVIALYITQVTRKGQTTIPVALRNALDIKPEDEVVWVPEGDRLVLEPRKKVKNPLKELARLRFKASKTAEQLCKEVEDEFW